LDGTSLSENTLTAHKTATMIIIEERKGVEIDGMETYNAPIIPKRTGNNKIPDLSISFSETAMLPRHELKPPDNSCLYPTRNKKNVKTVSVISSGIVDKGFEIPANNSNSLMKKPTNIKKTMLRPVEKRMVSTIFVCFSFKKLRRMKPGTNVR
jgi:hypothetical protein